MITMLVFLTAAVIWLAYANGANDNFKGVATLFGSGTTGYRKALALATITTFLGSLTAIYIGGELVKTFSGKGLVPDSLVADPSFLFAVGAGAAGTVYLATRFGFPVSTTHAIMGSLVGAGLVAAGGDILWGGLVEKFMLPLLATPVLALILSLGLSTLTSRSPLISAPPGDACVCVGREHSLSIAPNGTNAALWAAGSLPTATLGTHEECLKIYGDDCAHLNTRTAVDHLHHFSAGAVSFARGLNDTPKVVALMVTAHIMKVPFALALVGIAMALGGILSSRRVADTMSLRITRMNHGDGLTANLVTAFLVIFVSRWGIPVSTTHVSCGALFGIGLTNGRARWKAISGIFLAWITTLPLAAALSGAVMSIRGLY